MPQMAVNPAKASAAASTCEKAIGLLGDDGGLDRDFLGVGTLLADVTDAEHFVTQSQMADTVCDR